MCKSYFNPADNQNIKHGAEFFMLQGTYEVNSLEEIISCGLKRNQRKIFKRNANEYNKLADHIGLIPVVMISPVDTMLITEGSEERRKFMDSIISQYDHLYLDDLINYNKALSHRNALLKQFAQSRSFDSASIEIWDIQLVSLGERIFEKRQDFIQRVSPIFLNHYRFVSQGREE